MARRGSRSARLSLADGRIRLLRALLIVCFLGIAGKALVLTATSSGLTAIAERQHQRTMTLPAHRGDILDRSGLVLAVGKDMRTVYATPRQLKDPAAAARRLARGLKIRRKPLEKQLRDRQRA